LNPKAIEMEASEDGKKNFLKVGSNFSNKNIIQFNFKIMDIKHEPIIFSQIQVHLKTLKFSSK
jgi:hypothetical protein